MSDDTTVGTRGETKRTLDRLFRLLADPHRRHTLYYLDEIETDVATLTEVADFIAEQAKTGTDETGRPDDTPPARIRANLHHNHLPRLAEAGFVDYDPRSQTIRNCGEPSLMAWAQHSRHELPYLRSLFCTSVIE